MRPVSVAAVMLCWLGVTAVSADVRPISDAERAAVKFAADYLAGGAVALVDDLAANSPIRRAGAATIPLEIETRLGPRGGAEWRLVTVVDALKDKAAAFEISYPSGIDDTVFFEMVKEGEVWKILDLRITAMPSSRKALFPQVQQSAGLRVGSTSSFDRIAVGGVVAAFVLAVVALVIL